MKVVLLFIFGCLALATAQVSSASANTLISGSLASVPSGDSSRQLDYYQIWVPENTLTIASWFNATGATSCDLYLNHNFQIVPCGSSYPQPDNGVNPCYLGLSLESYDGEDDSASLYPGSDYGAEAFYTLNNYLYLSVSRYSDLYDDQSCPYQIYVNITSCPVNQTGVYDGTLDAPVCMPITRLTTSGSSSTSMPTGTTVYSIPVPLNVGTLVATITSTSDDSYITGSTGVAASFDGDNYDYEVEDATSVGNNYVYTLNAYTPRAGLFYIVVQDSTARNETIMVTYSVCSNTMGGYNCSYTTVQLNSTTFLDNSIKTIAANPDNGATLDDEGIFNYFYVDIPVNTTLSINATLNVLATSDADTFFRRNGYTEYEYYDTYDNVGTGGDAYEYVLDWHTFWVGGRFFLGVQNEGDTAMNYTLTFGINAGTSTTGSGSTTSSGSTTGSGSTTASGTTSGSSTGTNGMATTTMSTGASTTSSAASVIINSFVVVAVFMMYFF